MHRAKHNLWMFSTAAVFTAILTVGTGHVHGQQQTSADKVPNVYRDACQITIKGKADAAGTFSMVFKPHGGEDTEFTVNVVKGMGAKEMTLAAGSNYKVTHDGNKVIVKKANTKMPALAVEMTHQKIAGVAIMIGKK
jgi:Fe2+ transport system protein B